MKHRHLGKQVALFTGALRRQAFRRSRKSCTASPILPTALDAVRVELWNDDHRLLRALLVLVATFSASFWYYALERLNAILATMKIVKSLPSFVTSEVYLAAKALNFGALPSTHRVDRMPVVID